jgi:hypothetical protein
MQESHICCCSNVFVFQHSFDLSEAYSDEMELFVEIKQSLGEHADVLDGCKASGVSFV